MMSQAPAEIASVPVLRSLAELPAWWRYGAVSIGNFDGVHQGHARIVERLAAMARRLGGPAVVFTFDPPPGRLLRPHDAPLPLLTTEQKASLLAVMGVDAVIAYPTDETFLQLSPEEFFEQIVLERLAARGLVEGPNFFFGRHRHGTIEVLQALCTARGIDLEIVPPVIRQDRIVSSSWVRELLAAGMVAEARDLLCRPYRLVGTVVRGAGRGTSLGYPTANLARPQTIVPAPGIYACRAYVEGVSWPAAVSLGPNLTFGEDRTKIEAYLIGYQGNLYDRTLAVDFLARLRDIKHFASVAELTAAMAQDVADAEKVVAAG
jgi:riboflavin kinase/FMN adenylyltransferase